MRSRIDVANVFFVVFCLFFPKSEAMFLASFMFANGPLLWAIPA